MWTFGNTNHYPKAVLPSIFHRWNFVAHLQFSLQLLAEAAQSQLQLTAAWHILEHHRISESPVFIFVKVRQWPKNISVVLDTYSSGELSISRCQLLDLWQRTQRVWEAKWVKTFSVSFTSISIFFYVPEMPVAFWRFSLTWKFGEPVVGGKLRDANSDCGVVRVGSLDLSTEHRWSATTLH